MNKNNNKKNIFLILTILATVILGIMAVVVALKLYQIGQKPVAPTVPESKPKAVVSACRLSFVISVASVTPSPTATPAGPTNTPTLTPTPPTATNTPPALRGCFAECSANADCNSGLECLTYSSSKKCLDSACPGETDCGCNSCWELCSEDWECLSGLKCLTVSSQKRCVKESCKTQEDCVCPVATSTPGGPTNTPGPTSTSRPTAEPTQPVTGLKLPTALGFLGGLMLFSIGLALIF